MKVLMLGSSGVGKSCLLLRYVENSFYENYFSTIGVDFVSPTQKFKTIKVDEKIAKMQIWDTAGQERFRNITKFYYKGAHGVMLVFDICQRSSFEELGFWLEDIHRYGVANIPVVLVGNKLDCAAAREVSSQEASRFAAENDMTYIETSAKENLRIDEAFATLAQNIKQAMDGNPTATRTSFVIVNSKPPASFKCCF